MAPANANLGNSVEYPKVYRPSVVSRIFSAVLGIFLCFIAIILLYLPSKGNANIGPFVMAGIIALTGVFLAISSWASKVTLYQDRIEQSVMFTRKVLPRIGILGYRIRVVKNSKLLELVPANSQFKAMTMTKSYADDPLFKTWLQGLSNLDEEDQKAVDQEIINDVSLGTTPEERLAKVASLRRITTFLSFGIIPVVIGLSIFPNPLWLAVAIPILCPWIAIALVVLWGENFTIISLDKKTMLRKGNLLTLISTPSMAFIIILLNPRGGMPNFPLNWHPLLIPSIVGGLLMVGVILLVSQGEKTKLPTLIGVLLFPMTVYAGGTLFLANGLLDHKPPSSYTLIVMNKHYTTGKGAADYLDVMSSDDRYDGNTTIKVDSSLYSTTDINGTVCAQIHPGALGMKWETVGHCQ